MKRSFETFVEAYDLAAMQEELYQDAVSQWNGGLKGTWSLPISTEENLVVTIPKAYHGDYWRIVNKLRLAGKPSDFTIECRGKSFEVHRAILAERSEFIRGNKDPLCLGPIRNGIVLDELSPYGMRKALTFLYTGYASYGAQLWQHAHVYDAARLLKIDELQSQALAGCKRVLDQLFGKKLDPADRQAFLGMTLRDDVIDGCEGILQRTGPSDRLRAYVVLTCLEHGERVEANLRLKDILIKHEPIAWRVGTEIQKQAEKQQRQAVSDALIKYCDSDLHRAAVRADAERLIKARGMVSKPASFCMRLLSWLLRGR